MVVDVGARFEHRADGIRIALKIGDEHLDRAAGKTLMDLPDRFGKDVRPEVGEIIAVDRRDHSVPQVELGNGLTNARWLFDVVFWRSAVRYRAIRAVPRTHIAQDHERGGAVFPAFADVGAMGFLADGMQVEFLHHLLEAHVVRASWRLHLEPRRFPLWERFASVTSHDLNQLLGHILLGEARGVRDVIWKR